VLRKTTGQIVAVHTAPGAFLQVPLLDELREVDLAFHRTVRDYLPFVTSDGVTMVASVSVGWELSGEWLAFQGADNNLPALQALVPFPTTFDPTALDRVLPFFAEAEGIVVSWTERVLRSQFNQRREAQIQRGLHAGAAYRNMLRDQIQAQVSPVGIRVRDVTVTCVPAPAITYARVEADAKAQMIERLVRVLGPGSQDLILRVLALDTMGGANNKVYSTLDMSNGTGPLPIQFVVGSDWN
jgi:hypothetical protein